MGADSSDVLWAGRLAGNPGCTLETQICRAGQQCRVSCRVSQAVALRLNCFILRKPQSLRLSFYNRLDEETAHPPTLAPRVPIMPGNIIPLKSTWRKVMTKLDHILKSRDITLPTKACQIKAMVFPVVMYGCDSWTIKKAECQRIDAFELWCWRRLLRVPWTARRSNQSILKEISPE